MNAKPQSWNHDEASAGCLSVIGLFVFGAVCFSLFAWWAFSREWSRRQDTAWLEQVQPGDAP